MVGAGTGKSETDWNEVDGNRCPRINQTNGNVWKDYSRLFRSAISPEERSKHSSPMEKCNYS